MLASLLVAVLLSPAAHADPPSLVVGTYADVGFAASTVPPESLALVGQAAGDPNTLEAALALPGVQLVTNAGMYHAALPWSRQPVGLHVQDGQTVRPLETRALDGNFGLRPNGVFWVDSRGAHVTATEDWAAPDDVRLATQSGPMLVRAGAVHPVFDPASTSRKLRSGVGVRADGQVVFAISTEPVRFYDFAVLFRDHLGCPDALFLDGTISGLHTPSRQVGATRRAYGGVLVVRSTD